MFRFIEWLRGKSDGQKKAFAFGASLAITLMLFGIWVSVLFPNAISSQPVIAQTSSQTDKPVSTVNRNVAQSYEAVKNGIAGLIDYIKGVKIQPEGSLEVVPTDQDKSQNRATNKGGSVIY